MPNRPEVPPYRRTNTTANPVTAKRASFTEPLIHAKQTPKPKFDPEFASATYRAI